MPIPPPHDITNSPPLCQQEIDDDLYVASDLIIRIVGTPQPVDGDLQGAIAVQYGWHAGYGKVSIAAKTSLQNSQDGAGDSFVDPARSNEA